MTEMTVMSGVERRRKWSDEQKLALLAEAFSPGSSVSEVARREDMCTGLLYRWRKDFRSSAGPAFSRVVLTPTPTEPEDASIVVEIGAARVRIGAAASAALVTATLKALR